MHKANPSALQRAIVETLEHRRLLATSVSFEALPLGPAGNPVTGVLDDPSGFRFTLRSGTGGNPGKASQIYGTPHGFPTKVLHAPEWGQQYVISHIGGDNFGLVSFDYAASRHGNAGDFIVTGTFADGSTQQQTVTFDSSKIPESLNLSWTDLTQVRISFAGGVNNAYGALDNFIFIGADAPQTSGTLQDPDPVAGPVRLSFDGRSWNESRPLLPLADDYFYVLGSSGLEPPTGGNPGPVTRQDPTDVRHYVTKHGPDGSLDRNWGTDGRADVPPALQDLLALDSSIAPRRRIQPMGDGFLMYNPTMFGGLIRFDSELNRDVSFGGGGTVPFSLEGQFTTIPGAGFATLEESIVRVYDRAGTELRSANIEAQILPLLFNGTGIDVRRIGEIGADDEGNLYIGVTNIANGFTPGDPDEVPFVGAAKFLPSLTLDTSYGYRGISRAGADSLENETHLSLFVNHDGRALLGLAESDGDRNVAFFDSSGTAGGSVRYASDTDIWESADVWEASFLEDGEVAFVIQSDSFIVDDFPGHSAVFPTRPFAVIRVGPQDAPHEIVTSFDAYEIPREMSGVFTDLNGTFVLGGFIEDLRFDGDFTTDIDHHAALWRVDPQLRNVVVDFEELPSGQISSGRYIQDGFMFSNRPGGGGFGLEPLVIHGAAQGFSSNVLSTTNWARRIDITRQDGQAFSLEGFGYSAGRWGEAGDFVLTGTFVDGGTQTQTVSFSSTVPSTLTVNWEDLNSVSINFAGGVNNAYGALDNFLLGHLPGGENVIVDVEEAPLGPTTSFFENGFTFDDRPSLFGSPTEPLQVLGPPHGFASKVLQNTNWGRPIFVEEALGGSFFLKSFDYGAGRWGEAGDFVLTGMFYDGHTETRTVSFSSKALGTLTLDWQDLRAVSINYAGGVNSAYGAVDNFVFIRGAAAGSA